MSTNVLKSLSKSSTALPEKKPADPVQEARNKLIGRLQEQSAMAADPSWNKEMKRWRKNKETGKRETTTEVARPKQSWFVSDDGIVFFVRKGHGAFVDFGKGQSGVALKAASEIPDLCEKLIAAVKNGELNSQLMTSKAAKKH